MYGNDEYQMNYRNLDFENTLRKYRMQHIVHYLQGVKTDNILEIGSGDNPLFLFYNDFKRMDIVEPGNIFYSETKSKIGGDQRISIINAFIEEQAQFMQNDYDVIVIGGFLHEIDNPEEVLRCVKKLTNSNTKVITYVPNADSFHRILAVEAGLIQSNYQFSENDQLFGRRNIFDYNSIKVLFTSCGYEVLKTESYFIKPFTNKQMNVLMESSILSDEILEGFFKIIKYFPQFGCEIFLEAI